MPLPARVTRDPLPSPDPPSIPPPGTDAGTPTLVVGLGDPRRGDDGVGLAVARVVAALGLPTTAVAEVEDPTVLLDLWRDCDLAVVVDAVHAGGRPGSVVRLDTGSAGRPVPVSAWAATGRGGTHALGLAAAVGLGRALGRLPRHVVLLGVEGACYERDHGLSPDLAAAVEDVVAVVLGVVDERAATAAR